MVRFFVSLLLSMIFMIRAGFAQEQLQDIAWVQVEAQPSLAIATDRARSYQGSVQDVTGFAVGGGWYAVVLGPYSAADAETALQAYRSEGLIPTDAFITFTSALGRQFWPEGVDTLSQLPAAIEADNATEDASVTNAVADAAVTTPVTPVTPAVPTTPQIQAEPVFPDETPREARASEAQLNRDERKHLQSMLKWAGFYNAAIDGAFGRGTRGSMSAWQQENGFEVTGVLTTRQRAFLSDQYNAVLKGLDLRVVTDAAAGIEMRLPTGVVAFDRYESPFAHYNATGSLPGRVLLISQPGDQAMFYGLYDIMQTLEIVPLDGARERGKNSFTLLGEDGQMVSYTEASLKDGEIKGFTLIWPAGDEERRTRLLSEMKASFKRLDGALDPVAGSDADQSIDLISGLEIRKPRLSRSGFFIDASGIVVTSTEAVQNCTKITLDGEYEASVIASNPALGVAILKPNAPLAPMAVATLLNGTPRLQSDVAVSGYSFEGVLSAPTLTFGKLADLRGLRGEAELKRLALAPLPGDTGGPVFDAGGAVLGMLLPEKLGGQQLPQDVSFAADASAIQVLLTEAGVSTTTQGSATPMAPEDLTRHASGMTVLVSCW